MSLVVAPGAHVEIREVVWRVVRVDRTSTGGQAWHVIGISEIVRDQTATFLSDLEGTVKVLDPAKTQLVLDTSSQHRAGRLYVESMLRQMPPTDDAIYMGHRAVMDELPYQLEPAHQALQRPRQRILIADAVGLGKTLEAGILLAELAQRGRARRVLVVTTKSMLTQFQKELWCRFSFPLVRLDSVGLQRIRQHIPTHHNPFYAFDRIIISIDTLKQNNAFRAHVEKAQWDVVIIDEAHNVAARGNRRSQRADVAQVLADNCDHLILLSATPHDGKAESFASLMHLLDPTAIANPSDYGKEDIKQLYTRRFRKDVAEQLEGAVPEREIIKRHAPASPAEEHAFDVLTSLKFERIDAAKHGGVLFRTQLEKALFSSPAACLKTTETRIRNLKARTDPERFTHDIAELERLHDAVMRIEVDDNTRLATLLDLLQEWDWKPRRAAKDRLVIFTERVDTLKWLEQQLGERLGLKRHTKGAKLTDAGIVMLYGGLPDTDQQAIVEAFGQGTAKIRILLATDVASEGINLHYLSHRLVHFDVPWSLMVFQQRNGRVDRYGQSTAPQLAYLLVDSDNARIKGDQRILEVLIAKDEQAQKNIGDPAALMGEYDSVAEEARTAAAMDEGQSAGEFSDGLDGMLDLDLDAMLSDDAPLVQGARTGTLPSLYTDDFAYVVDGLEQLATTHAVRASIRPAERLIELTWPDDLKRRYRRLPREIRPADGVLLLTADPKRMRRAIEDARRTEAAWPVHQYLWAQSPVVQWLTDRLQAGFGRHAAPVLQVGAAVCPVGHAIVLVSGQLPNQRSQPLVHRWYAVHFDAARRPGQVEPFEAFQGRTDFGEALPNRSTAPSTEPLQALLPVAIERASAQTRAEGKAWSAEMAPQLRAQVNALDGLRDRQLSFWADHFVGRASGQSEAQARRINKTFVQYGAWIREAMTLSEKPFMQIIAVLVHPGAQS